MLASLALTFAAVYSPGLQLETKQDSLVCIQGIPDLSEMSHLSFSDGNVTSQAALKVEASCKTFVNVNGTY